MIKYMLDDKNHVELYDSDSGLYGHIAEPSKIREFYETFVYPKQWHKTAILHNGIYALKRIIRAQNEVKIS